LLETKKESLYRNGTLDISNNSNPFPRLVLGVEPLKGLNSQNQRFNKGFNCLSTRTTQFYDLIFTIFFSFSGLLLTHDERTRHRINPHTTKITGS